MFKKKFSTEKIDEKMENFNRELESTKKNQMGILLVEKNLKLRAQKNGVKQKIIYSIRQGIMNWTKVNGNDSNRNAKS